MIRATITETLIAFQSVRNDLIGNVTIPFTHVLAMSICIIRMAAQIKNEI